MQENEKSLLPAEIAGVAKRLNGSVAKVIGDNNIQGFEKAYLIAQATIELREALTPEYMKPIMALQGSKLGFKSDKAYPENVVKDCVIEAVLTGVQPCGNHFNIIAGNCYITKEGFGYLLGKLEGIDYKIIPELPRIQGQSAAVKMQINWTANGKSNSETIDFAIKVNQYSGADAVIGKATRKARAWLFNSLTGAEIGDGDVNDVTAKTIDTDYTDLNKEAERAQMLIENASTPQEVDTIFNGCTPDIKVMIEDVRAKKMEGLLK